MDKFKKIVVGICFWLVELTWGAFLTYPGFIITLFVIIFLHGKPHKNGYSYIVEIGGNWGGLEIGAVALCGEYTKISPDYYEYIRRHEFGHNVQQLIFGPLQFFIVGIPSICRYWWRTLNPDKVHTGYDDVWFEGTATRWGTSWINWLSNI